MASKTYWLATTRRDGRPHTVPVDGIWWAGALYFGGDPATVHVRNLRTNPRTVLHTESGASPVIAEGVAEWHQPSRDEISGLVQATQTKYGYPVSPDSYSAGIWRLRRYGCWPGMCFTRTPPASVRPDGIAPWLSLMRLVTFVDVDSADLRRISVSALHEAELADGRRLLLLDDRGWSESGPLDIWATTSVEDIVFTARTVVGPDEPFGGRTLRGHGDRPLGPAGRQPPAAGDRRRRLGAPSSYRTTSCSASDCSRASAASRAPMIRVQLVDDDAMVRAGVRAILAAAEDIAVVAEAADGRQALRAGSSPPPRRRPARHPDAGARRSGRGRRRCAGSCRTSRS